MKEGCKHKTGYFGSAGEAYCASLFQMVRVHDGFSRPDLITDNEEYQVPLAVEVKSGKDFKSVINIGSLFYTFMPLTASGEPTNLSEEDFRELINDFDPNKSVKRSSSLSRVYFDSLSRKDIITAKELQNPFSSIRFQWGDQFLVPGEYAFSAFVVSDFMRRGRSQGMTLEKMARNIKENLFHIATETWERQSSGTHDYQNMNCIDMRYFFERDDSLMGKGHSRERVGFMRQLYPQVDNLIPVLIPGPNGTQIKILSSKEDLPLFKVLRKIVDLRKPLLEQVAQKRKLAEKLLQKTRFVWQRDFGDIYDLRTEPEKNFKKTGADLNAYSREELVLLARLQNWLLPGEDIKYLDASKAVMVETSKDPKLNLDEGDAPF
jgi:hypothetical protein